MKSLFLLVLSVSGQVTKDYGIELGLFNGATFDYILWETNTEPTVGQTYQDSFLTGHDDELRLGFKGVNAYCDIWRDNEMVAKQISICDFRDFDI